MSGSKDLRKNDVLFREGELAEALYVIKSGKIAITKNKGSSEIVLAELGPGDMLGEMGFFDGKPRSANARAIAETVVIELPFKALNVQFRTFPEWLKAVVRTISAHLRAANVKIKNLERASDDDAMAFSPDMIVRLAGTLALVGKQYGEPAKDGVSIPQAVLRRWTIQVFQLPTAKMQLFMETLQSLGHFKIEDLGEGKQLLVARDISFLFNFAEYYNDWIFRDESKRITVEERDLRPLKALIAFAKKAPPDERDSGRRRVNLTTAQAAAIAEIGYAFGPDDVNSLIEKKLASEKVGSSEGVFVGVDLAELSRIEPYWELIHKLLKIPKN